MFGRFDNTKSETDGQTHTLWPQSALFI